MQSRSDFPWHWTRVTETTLVHTGPGTMHTIVINDIDDGATITLYDGVDAGGAVIGVLITALHQPVTLIYDLMFDDGLYIAIAGQEAFAELTVNWM